MAGFRSAEFWLSRIYEKLTGSGSTAAEVQQGAAGADAWPVSLQWTPALQADEAANDSDKVFTVPASTEWHVYSIWVEFVSSGTAGNRQVAVEIQDGESDVVARVKAGITQAGSLTRTYLFAPGVVDLGSFRDTADLMTPIPPTWILPAGYRIRIYDSAAVDAAADDMVVQALIAARGV